VIHLYRARLAVLCAVVLGVGALVVEFPLSELVHQRGQLVSVSGQLATVDAHNAQLRADVSSLSHAATIAAVAHEEYGLIAPGQESFVILPQTGAKSPDPLSVGEIPISDLVAAPPPPATTNDPVAAPAPPPAGSLWSRTVSRLEFWRWAF
jgi:hypothetical protein